MKENVRSVPVAEFNWPLLQARFAYWPFTVLTKFVVSIVYFPLISRGLQQVFPEIGLRLYKCAGFGFMEHYTALYRITLADVFTVIPFVLCWLLWSLIL